jgi:signal transduction histidine kinase/CHASE3 domain sensor protein
MNISIRGRLASGFGLVFVLAGIGLAISLLQTRRMNEMERRRAQVVAPAVQAVNDLTRAYLREGIALRSYALDQSPQARTRFEQLIAQGRLARVRLSRLTQDPTTRTLIDDLSSVAEQYDLEAERFERLIDTGVPANELHTAELQLDKIRSHLLDDLARLEQSEMASQRTAEDAAARARRRIVDGLLLVALLTFGVGGLSAILTTNAVRRPAARLLDAARALGRGDYAPARALAPATGMERHFRDELRELAAAFGTMAVTLDRRQAQITASSSVSRRLASSIDPESVAEGALGVLAEWSGLQVGVVYLARNDRLEPLARHATPRGVDTLGLHEGIPGEAAASGRTIIVADVPADTPFQLRFGVDQLAPRTVLAVPMYFEAELVGVLLLAGLRTVDAETIAVIEQCARQLAISLRNALAHEEVQRLARELEERNVQLRAHVEEVQAQNEEIQAQNEEIQSLSEEIRAQNESLKQHNDVLAESDRQKDELISVASHELRTPLSALTMSSQLLLRRLERAEPTAVDTMKSDADRICKQVQRLSGHVDRLLDFSRARMGRLELRPATMDLAAALRDLVNEMRVRSPERKLVLDIDADALRGEWDRGYLDQVFMNLIENAIRYSPSGGDVKISAGIVAGELRVAVRDEGIGIPAAAMERLFNPYFRHPEARQIAQSGMGIGLYVTRQIVSAHGGRIWADSEPGCGSTFTVALPLAVVKPAVVPSEPAQAAAHVARSS